MSLLKYVIGLAAAAVLTACGGGGGSPGTGTTAAVSADATANASVASIKFNEPSGRVLNADGTTSLTFTVYALTGGNANVSGATINLAATSGVILSKPSVVTSESGATVTVIANSSDQSNKVVTLTASCLACSASSITSLVNVVGASIALADESSSALIVGGSSTVLSVTVKDAFSKVMSGVDVSFASTDPLVLGLSLSSSKTNASGVATVNVTGLAAGSASINVTALGDIKSKAFTSGLATTVLAVTSPSNNSVVTTSVGQPITVSAPGATAVLFATTRGTFANAASSQSVAVVGNTASVTLTVGQAGTASITMIDNLARQVNLVLIVSPPVSAVNKILLSASQTSLPVSSVSGLQSSIRLTARAVLFDGSTDQSVANVPIAFSMSGGPGAGEFLTPALAYTNSAGEAVATFTSGTAASISNGIVVSASVQNSSPAVQTGVLPSNKSAVLTIGGKALSVAFGPATVLSESTDKTMYSQAYSAHVLDANNNPVIGQKVTLRVRPVAFSLGAACTFVATYCSEDANGNGSLDAAEDGARTTTTEAAAGTCPIGAPVSVGSVDGDLTPSNSDGGGVPSTVETDENGIAKFDLTYLKGSAIWIISRLTATVTSNGTETSKSTVFRLPGLKADIEECVLPPSPYSF